MGCSCLTAKQPYVNLQELQTPDVLKAFISFNAKQLQRFFSLYPDLGLLYPTLCGNEEQFLSGFLALTAFHGGVEAIKLLADIGWTSLPPHTAFRGVEGLISLIEMDNPANFHMLRFLFYLTAKDRKHNKTWDCGEYHEAVQTLARHQQDSEEGFSVLLLCCSLQPTLTWESLTDFCMRSFLNSSVQSRNVQLAIYCFLSSNLKGIHHQSPMLNEIAGLDTEQFRLLLDTVGYFHLNPEALKKVLVKLNEVQLNTDAELLFPLFARAGRILLFIDFFKTENDSMLCTALSCCQQFIYITNDQTRKNPRKAEHVTFLSGNDILSESLLAITSLTEQQFTSLARVMRDFYDLQFQHLCFNKKFNERYLLLSPSFSSVTECIGKLILYYSASQEISPLFIERYFTLLLQANLESRICTLGPYYQCIRICPKLANFLLQTTKTTLTQIQSMKSQISAEECSECEMMEQLFRHIVGRCENSIRSEHSAELQTVNMDIINRHIEDYKKSVLRVITELNNDIALSVEDEFSQILRTMQKPISRTQQLEMILLQVMSHSLSRLTLKREKWNRMEFKEKWRAHLTLFINIIQSHIIKLIFDADATEMFVSFVFSSIWTTFSEKKSMVGTENSCSVSLHMRIIRIYLGKISVLTPEERDLMSFLANSKCNIEAMTELKLDTELLEPSLAHVYFADLEELTYGVTLYGGVIFLNSRLRGQNIKERCLLRITILHELAHCIRRYKDGVLDISARSPSMSMTMGVPGDDISVKFKTKEGGYLLETTLFGSIVIKLTESQAQFLLSDESWKKPLHTFKAQLQIQASQSSHLEVLHFAREADSYCFERRECKMKGY